MLGPDGAARRLHRYNSIGFSQLLHRAVAEESHAALTASLRDPGEIFQRMKGCLPGIAQDVTILTAIEWHADEPMDRGSDVADLVHLLVDGLRRHIAALEEIAVEPPKVASNPFFLLDFFNAVDGSGLAVAKEF